MAQRAKAQAAPQGGLEAVRLAGVNRGGGCLRRGVKYVFARRRETWTSQAVKWI